ncbi:MAG: hypothetical protein ABI140_14845 [Jatrophihabitantaceae bacterium]
MVGKLQARLVERRVALWQGRISAAAARQTLLAYELIFLSYLAAIVLIVMYVISDLIDWRWPARVLLLLTFAVPALCLALALRSARTAGLAICRQYGLPAKAWRRVKAKTPKQFDQWIAGQTRLTRPASD